MRIKFSSLGEKFRYEKFLLKCGLERIVRKYRRFMRRWKGSQFPRVVELPSSAFKLCQPDLYYELLPVLGVVEDRMNDDMDYEESDEYQGGHYEFYHYGELRQRVANEWMKLFNAHLNCVIPGLKMVFGKAWGKKQYNYGGGGTSFKIKGFTEKWFIEQVEVLANRDGFYDWLWKNYVIFNHYESFMPRTKFEFLDLCNKVQKKNIGRREACEKLMAVILHYYVYPDEEAQDDFRSEFHYRLYESVDFSDCFEWYKAEMEKEEQCEEEEELW